MTDVVINGVYFDDPSNEATSLIPSVIKTRLVTTVRPAQSSTLGASIMTPIRAIAGNSSDEGEETTHYVLGATHVGIAVAEQLQAAGHEVAIVDESYESSDIPGFNGDPATVDVLSESGVESASTVLVVTGSDRRNLLIAQLVRAHFEVPRVIALVNDPDRASLFAEAGHEPFCVTTVVSEAFSEAI